MYICELINSMIRAVNPRSFGANSDLDSIVRINPKKADSCIRGLRILEIFLEDFLSTKKGLNSDKALICLKCTC